MEEPLGALQARIEGLVRELEQIKRRLEVVETRLRIGPARSAGAASRPEPGLPATGDLGTASEPTIPVGMISLIGRTLVVLGGAYLLRTLTPITDARGIPALGGATAGLAYGVLWLLQADRSAGAGRRLSAAFHGFAAVAITYPLVWETTTRFHLLSAAAAACALIVLLALGLVVAWRRELGEIAWASTICAVATTVGLLVGTRDLMPLTCALLLMAAGVEALALRERWLGLRWPVAAVVDMAVLLMITIMVRRQGIPEGYVSMSPVGVVAVALALPGLYLTSVAVRSLVYERLVTPFEVVQVAAALLVGFGGAAKVVAFNGGNATAVGLASLGLGAACYGLAFAFVDRRSGRGRNFYCYTTFAGLLTLVGSAAVVGGTVLTFIWGLLAVASIWLGGRFDRITLRFHGAVYLAVAAVAAGLVACTADGLLANPAGPWRPVTPTCLGMALLAGGCYGMLLATGRRTVSGWVDLLPQAVIAAAVVWITAGLAVTVLAGEVADAPGAAADVAFVATTRTAVLSLLAVALAWTGGRWSLAELTWLVYPLLIGGGVRLVLEDLRYGRPLTLFLTLALYGGALIAIPHLMKRER